MFDVIPAIDLRRGRVVRLAQGDFQRETIYHGRPDEVARGFAAAGARWIHVVDLDGAREGRPRQSEVVAAIVTALGGAAACELGGGLRDRWHVDAALASGVRRVVLGTAALHDSNLAAGLVARHGADRIAVGLDVRAGRAVGEAWREGAPGIDAEAALIGLAGRGVERFVVTAVEQDGLLRGPDLGLLERLVRTGAGAVVASGGMSDFDDLRAVREIGCVGVIIGRALYEGRIDLAEALALESS